MSPTDYMQLPIKKYVQFTGRSDRPEYWWFYLLTLVVSFGGVLVRAVLGSTNPLAMVINLILGLASLALIIPGIAVGFRRLHDTDRTAWWLLIGLIPILGWIAMIYFLCQPGTQGANRYGNDPKSPLGDLAKVF